MKNSISIEELKKTELVKLIKKNFDIEICKLNGLTYILFGRDTGINSISYLMKEFAIEICESYYELITISAIDGYICVSNITAFTNICDLYDFIKINIDTNFKSNVCYKPTTIKSLEININDLDNEFISRLTALKLSDKLGEFMKIVTTVINCRTYSKIIFNEDEEKHMIECFVQDIHKRYAFDYKRRFADDFCGIDLRIFKKQFINTMFTKVRSFMIDSMYEYKIKPQYNKFL